MTKITDNQKMLILLGVTLLLCGLGGAGIWWASDRAANERQLISGMRDQIKAAEQKINLIPAAERDVIILRENVHEYVKILPEEKEQNTFVRTANQFLSQANITARSIQMGKTTITDGGQFERFIYTVQLEGTLWQFMKFMNLFENYERFVSVKGFKLDSGANKQKEATPDGDVPHMINMTLETYVYRGTAKGKDVVIPNYNSKRDNLRDDIVRNLQAIPKEHYEFHDARGRRDIFVDPRETNGSGGTKGMSVPMQAQRKLIDKYKGEVARLKEVYDRSRENGITIFERYNMDRTLKKGLETLTAEVEDVNQKRIISYQPFKLTWQKEVTQPLEVLTRDVAKGGTEGGDDRWLSERELNELLAAMKEDLAAGELGSAKERYETVQERVKVPHTDRRYNLAFAVQTLYHRTKLALEFSALKLNISGVCVNDAGRSGLILNGEVMEEGDYVNDDLFIKTVGREQVEFVYKGFTLIKTW